MLDELVAAKCSWEKIALSTHRGDMLQGCVAGTCSRDQIAELAQMCQGHVAATHPLVCAAFLSLTQNEICVKFGPATCHTEVNSLNFMGHVNSD